MVGMGWGYERLFDLTAAASRTPDGVPALHGVAHQISEEQMERIKETEGGGGNKDMGAHAAKT